MSLLSDALDRLQKQAAKDEANWHLGKQLSDAMLVNGEINRLRNDLNLAKDALYLHTGISW